MTRHRFFASLMGIIYLGTLNPVILYGAEPAVSPSAPAIAEQSHGEAIRAEAGGTVSLSGARIVIPAGALEEDTVIRITKLRETADTGESMINVTSGGGGYRFEPAGTQFLKEVTIELPYDVKLNGKEGSLDDVRSYYYDVKEERWIVLEKKGYDKERGVIESVTTHFTDMINGTLSLPESAGPIDVNLNSIKGLEAANASVGVAKLEGLEGTSDGSAGFSLKLDLPGGRRGMRPAVAIQYSSGGGIGITGKGFDVQYGSRIEIDTRYGAARYDGSDSYTLDGVRLKVRLTRVGETEYERLREQSFSRIVHIKTESENYWEVTERDGSKKTYGKGDESWGGKGSTEKNIWYLEKEEDVYGNTIVYEYIKDGGYVYPLAIWYTGKGTDKGPYVVRFEYGTGRPDKRVDMRGGYTQELGCLLERIVVTGADGNELRSYGFEYKGGVAEEQYVTALVGFDRDSVEWWRYGFEYNEIERDKNGALKYFADPEFYGNSPLWVTSNEQSGSQFSAGAGVGIGGPDGIYDLRVTGGYQYSNTSSTTYSQYTMADINGDGLIDTVWQEGNALYARLNTGNGFEEAKRVIEITGGLDSSIDIEKEKGSSTSHGGMYTPERAVHWQQ
ncbi:hypothetical protein K7I13_08515 [Brucepastera parasyntrophica]|uniref:SpvB/TcaC N-terminal domain-containing protein n=1 Tax=Brucepastera parasyntrophica TaxID=2880008 RepID=UPI002108F68E|nr:SpvB/TcaC N-terminal domain-containing protein [Brucepastera parasyntrophica]ULQ58608.1 hypothetical protein K7I13_08515 [Brucepastera parasyntrophica]